MCTNSKININGFLYESVELLLARNTNFLFIARLRSKEKRMRSSQNSRSTLVDQVFHKKKRSANYHAFFVIPITSTEERRRDSGRGTYGLNYIPACALCVCVCVCSTIVILIYSNESLFQSCANERNTRRPRIFPPRTYIPCRCSCQYLYSRGGDSGRARQIGIPGSRLELARP